MFEADLARWELMPDEERDKVAADLLAPRPRCVNCHFLFAGGLNLRTRMCVAAEWDENVNCQNYKPAFEGTRVVEERMRL